MPSMYAHKESDTLTPYCLSYCWVKSSESGNPVQITNHSLNSVQLDSKQESCHFRMKQEQIIIACIGHRSPSLY